MFTQETTNAENTLNSQINQQLELISPHSTNTTKPKEQTITIPTHRQMSKPRRKPKTSSSEQATPCNICSKLVHQHLGCELCDQWLCIDCAKISSQDFNILVNNAHTLIFICETCIPKHKQLCKEHIGSNNIITGNTEAEKQMERIESRLKNIERTILDLTTTSNTRANKTEEVAEEIKQTSNNMMASYASKVKELNTVSQEIKETIERKTNEITQTDNQPTKQIIDSLKEYNERETKKRNLVIYGLTEKGHIPTQLQALCRELGVKGIEITESKRLGTLHPTATSRPRPLLIKLKTLEQKRILLQKAKTLRQSSTFANTYISPDLTQQERDQNKKLIEELKQRRANGEIDLIIKRGEIVQKTGNNTTTASILIQ